MSLIDNMKTLEITTAIGCTNACVYCPQDKLISAYSKSENTFLQLQDFKKYLEKIPITTKLHFSGYCEPFQNPDAIEMMEHAFGEGYHVGIFTTTIGLDFAKIYKLKSLNSWLRTFSPFYVHIPQRKTDEFLRNITLMESLGLDFSIIKVGNHVESEAVREYLLTTSKPVMYQEEVTRAGNLSGTVAPSKMIGAIRCRDNRQFQNVLLPSGDVQICCQDYSLKYTLGNLKSIKRIEEFYDGDVFKSVVTQMGEENNDLICRWCYRAEHI